MSDTLDIVHPAITDYLKGLSAAADDVRMEMESYALANDFPIVGPLVGEFLAVLAGATGVKRIFELGSGFGYSALWFSRATADDARITCTELDESNIQRGRDWHRKAGVSHKIEWVRGDALQTLRDATGTMDLIFCDIDKTQYPEALELAWPRLNPGGLMVTDNVLWSGRVTCSAAPDSETAAITAFTRSAYALPDGDSTIIPIRDGVLVSLKRKG